VGVQERERKRITVRISVLYAKSEYERKRKKKEKISFKHDGILLFLFFDPSKDLFFSFRSTPVSLFRDINIK
jgi:hypothetical protein